MDAKQQRRERLEVPDVSPLGKQRRLRALAAPFGGGAALKTAFSANACRAQATRGPASALYQHQQAYHRARAAELR